ncbi:hypothetical protein A0H81_11738 [Grifola frondosa]|uniref:Uncharacterized protein n=1 Tax=Grifola frondosa TaxID=5627 RepID=A0A1C7LTI7_GRIFR|nr:hypothetical protein A0H81_11738 [Grifola frondosa]
MDHIPLAQHQNSGSRGIRHSPAQPMVQASRMQLRQDVPEYSLRGSEPIDLTTLLRQRDEYPAKGNYPDYDFNTQSHSPDGRDLRIYDLANEVGLDWRTLLLEQERLGKSGLSSSRSPYVNEVRDQPQPLMVASPSSSLSAAGSFRFPIILEHLAGHLPPNTGPRRLSALEIAQKYRQQQLQHHQQNFLPTPPSSSSPIWSSRFSPYQGSVFSPELLAASGLSKMSPSILHSTLPLPDPPHRLPQVSRSQLNNLGFTTRKIPSLAPPAQISDSYKYQTCATSGRTSNAMSAHLLPDNASIQTRRTSNLSSPVARSPAHPRPPPNTPLAVASSPYNLKYSDNRTQPSIMATPPSPSSPDPHSRTISHQQPRSIPLSRLIQRRLSAVPEEDYVSSTEYVHPFPYSIWAYSPCSHSLIEPQIATASAIRRLLSPTSVQQTNLRTSSPANGMFVAQSKTSNFAAEDLLPLEDGSVQAMVRLPGAGSKIGYTNRNGSSGLNGRNDSVQHGGSHKDNTPKRVENTRGRGQKRNGRGRKGRGAAAGNVVNGPERVDGGLMVKS